MKHSEEEKMPIEENKMLPPCEDDEEIVYEFLDEYLEDFNAVPEKPATPLPKPRIPLTNFPGYESSAPKVQTSTAPAEEDLDDVSEVAQNESVSRGTSVETGSVMRSPKSDSGVGVVPLKSDKEDMLSEVEDCFENKDITGSVRKESPRFKGEKAIELDAGSRPQEQCSRTNFSDTEPIGILDQEELHELICKASPRSAYKYQTSIEHDAGPLEPNPRTLTSDESNIAEISKLHLSKFHGDGSLPSVPRRNRLACSFAHELIQRPTTALPAASNTDDLCQLKDDLKNDSQKNESADLQVAVARPKTHFSLRRDEKKDTYKIRPASLSSSSSMNISQSKELPTNSLKSTLKNVRDLQTKPKSKIGQASVTQSSSAQIFPKDLAPVACPVTCLSDALLKLESADWEENVSGFKLLIRLLRHHTDLVREEVQNINMTALKQVSNLRSQVSRAACLFFEEMFTSLGKLMDHDAEKIATKLLDRSVDTNKFIRESSGAALDSMARNVHFGKTLHVLDCFGSKHKNPLVKTMSSKLTTLIVKLLGSEKCLTQIPEKLLPMLINFLQEGSLETRSFAKESLTLLVTQDNFDRILKQHVPSNSLRNVEKVLNGLKGQAPVRKPGIPKRH